MRAFSCWISGVLEELLPPPLPPPPLPVWLLEAAEDIVEPDEEEEVLEDVLPDALVVDAVLLVSELDADVLADLDVVVPLVPSPAAAAEVVGCICMVLEFNTKLRDAAARGQSALASPEKFPISTQPGLTAPAVDFFRPLGPGAQQS
jgi:hypothetical protein